MRKIEKQIKDYLAYCEEVRGMSNTTMSMKRDVLARFVGATGILRLEDLTNEVFNKWVAHESARKISPRSINMYNAIVVAMVRYYREMGLSIPINLVLVKKLKEERVRRNFYTFEEIERVITMTDERVGLIVRIMFETGMRIAEITKLRRVNFDERRIEFIGKGRKYR